MQGLIEAATVEGLNRVSDVEHVGESPSEMLRLETR